VSNIAFAELQIVGICDTKNTNLGDMHGTSQDKKVRVLSGALVRRRRSPEPLESRPLAKGSYNGMKVPPLYVFEQSARWDFPVGEKTTLALTPENQRQ
jgi:hypothetical protein